MSLRKVNRIIRLDPDFGTPEEIPSLAFHGIVVPPDTRQEPWPVIIIIPPKEYPDDGFALCKEVLRDFLEPKDDFRFDRLQQEQWKLVTPDTPIISYDPVHITDFYWFRPPRYLMQ